jgi:hypothetical protein
MCWRWYRIHEGSEPIQPSCRVVNKNELSQL